MFGTILGPDSGLERPRFGQFARQIVGITTAEIELALAEQRRQGGRIGEILCRRKILTGGQCLEVLRAQARWVARSLRADVAPARLPYPAYLSVCMPAFNEAGNIRATLEAAAAMLPELVEDFELVVVDDGSKDGTAAVVEEFADQTGAPLRLVRHPVNRGYGAAVTTALRADRKSTRLNSSHTDISRMPASA